MAREIIQVMKHPNGLENEITSEASKREREKKRERKRKSERVKEKKASNCE